MSCPIKYSRAVFNVIVGDSLDAFVGLREQPRRNDDRSLESVRTDDQGFWVNPGLEPGSHTELTWTYLCELESGQNDSLNQPALRFDFTAAELAAFMLDGLGYFVRERYGRWEDGPDPEALPSGVHSAQPREALEHAFTAYRAAEAVVGRLEDQHVEDEATLRDRYDISRRDDESDVEWAARTREFFERVLPAYQKRSRAETEFASAERKKWRKRMVQRLVASTQRDQEIDSDEPAEKAPIKKASLQLEAVLRFIASAKGDPKTVPLGSIGKSGLRSEALEYFVARRADGSLLDTDAKFKHAWDAYLQWRKEPAAGERGG